MKNYIIALLIVILGYMALAFIPKETGEYWYSITIYNDHFEEVVNYMAISYTKQDYAITMELPSNVKIHYNHVNYRIIEIPREKGETHDLSNLCKTRKAATATSTNVLR